MTLYTMILTTRIVRRGGEWRVIRTPPELYDDMFTVMPVKAYKHVNYSFYIFIQKVKLLQLLQHHER
jgi:hypothetical protein